MSPPAWQQVLAAVLAAVIPVVVKYLNDWRDRLERQSPTVVEKNVRK